jgi:acyl-CoA synthetase (AMP-forming)/AMP-acid ligase II
MPGKQGKSIPTLFDIVRARAERDPDRFAFAFLERGETVTGSSTYSELDRRARALAAWLQERGLQGERALLLFPPGLDFVTAFVGSLASGTVAVPASLPRLSRNLQRLRSIVRDARPTVALTTSDLLPRVRPWVEEVPELGELAWLAVDELGEEMAGEWRPPSLSGSDLAFLQYTSGSTASPKGVMVSHGNLLHNCEYLRSIAEDDEESVGASWLPHFHDMGLVDGILHPLYSGYPSYLMSPLSFLQRPARWLEAISRYRVTNTGGPNFAFDLCVQKVSPEQRARLDLRSWRMAYNGAEPVRGDTLHRFAATFAECGFRWRSFYPVYGLAEATLVVSSGQLADEPKELGVDAAALERHRVETAMEGAKTRNLVGCGRVSSGMQAIIVDPETRTRCAPGLVGEIWVAGPSVAQGYWERPEASADTFRARLADTGEGPFLRTGDLGFFDGQELFIAGRLKDLIILGGRNHHPQDLELTAEQAHAAVRSGSCAAFTVEEEGEEKLVIAAEVARARRGGPDRAGAEVAADRPLDAGVTAAIRRAIAEAHDTQVHRVVLLEPGALPKTSSGKLQRHACRAGFLAQELRILEVSW